MRAAVRFVRRSLVAAPLFLLVVMPAALGQSDDREPGPITVRLSGLAAGDVVADATLSLTVEPVGYEFSADGVGSAAGDGLGHYHVHIDGALSGDFVTSVAVIDLGGVEPGPHTLTVLPAANDHTEMADGAVDITFDHQPGSPTVTVSLREWLLDPSELTLAAGTYTFVAPNDGVEGHALVIDGEGLRVGTPDASYPAGASQSFTVTLAPGIYELLCPVPWHKSVGMSGEVIVTE